MPAPPISHAAERLPALPYARVLLSAVLVAAAGFALLEGFWRLQGFTPSVTDGEDLWAVHYARLCALPENSLVMLGRSRIQQAFQPEPFHEVLPGVPFVQLAVGGQHALGTLRELAERTDYAGTVVVDINAESLLPEVWDQQAGYLDYYRAQWDPLFFWSRNILTVMQQHAVVLLPELILQRALPDVLRGQIEQQFLWTRPDRTQHVDYRKVDIAAYTATQLAKIEHNLATYRELPGYTTWTDNLDTIDGWVRQIQARGGEVLFVRMPTSGAYRAAEAETFPRAAYWDLFAANTSAATWHFEDVPELRDMVCAEGTHLYEEDARTFTEVFARYLRERGFLTPAE